MKIIVSGRNIELTQAIKDHVIGKLDWVSQHFDFIQEVHVFVSVQKNPSIKNRQTAEATVHVNGAIIRAAVSSENLYTSIDQLVEKIDRSLSKHKSKLLHRSKSSKSNGNGVSSSIRHIGLEEFETFEPDEDETAAAAKQAPEAQAYEEFSEIFLTYSSEEFSEIDIPASKS